MDANERDRLAQPRSSARGLSPSGIRPNAKVTASIWRAFSSRPPERREATWQASRRRAAARTRSSSRDIRWIGFMTIDKCCGGPLSSPRSPCSVPPSIDRWVQVLKRWCPPETAAFRCASLPSSSVVGLTKGAQRSTASVRAAASRLLRPDPSRPSIRLPLRATIGRRVDATISRDAWDDS